MTIKQFRLSEVLRSNLAEALRAPAMQQAMQAVLASCVPDAASKNEPGLHPDTALAHRYHRLAGRAECLRLLERMTHPLQPDEMVEEEDFAHALPTHLRTNQ